jgi:hypothetical protein
MHATRLELELDTIWGALQSYRENCIPEYDSDYDEEWESVLNAMDYIIKQLDKVKQ